MNILAGAIVMQESVLYSPGEFCLMVFFGLISCAGVVLIIKKPKPLQLQMDIETRYCSHKVNCECLKL